MSKLFLKLTLRLSALCAALVLPGCLVVIGPPAERVSRALEASEEAGQAAEEGGEDGAVTEN